MPLNLHHLAVFHAVAETGSVTAAADRLAVSQPAVSKQLKLLERHLGVDLFERAGRRMRPTDAGDLLASYARRIFGLADEAARAMGDLHSLRRGRLAVAASPTVAAYLLPRLLVRFRQRFPGVHVTVDVGNADTLRRKVEDRAADFALTEADIKSPSLDTRKFMDDDLVLIVRARHPLARKTSVSLSDLASEPWIARDPSPSGAPSLLERTLNLPTPDNRNATRCAPILTLGSTEAVKEAVAEGLGIALVPRLTLGPSPDPRLRILRLKDKLPRRPFYQLRLPDRPPSKPETAFNCLLKHLARGPLPPLGGRPSSTRQPRP